MTPQGTEFTKRILTVDDLCSYTGLAKSYVYKLTMQGKIPGASKPTGKIIFFDREKIDQWLLGSPAMTAEEKNIASLLYTSPSPRDRQKALMPSSA